VLQRAPGKIIFRFHARDLHLVPGTAKDGKPVHFRVKIDGTAPGEDHGSDTDPNCADIVSRASSVSARAAKGSGRRIEFLDPGVQAFAFTFG
jgi:Thioredoxin like C-terminal domain